MKKLFILLLITCSFTKSYSQKKQIKISPDSVSVENKVEFYMFDGPYGEKENLKEPAIRFILTVKNKGVKPIPDLGVSNRSEYVNLIINDSINNPVSMYNGAEAASDHLIKKGGTDTYTWWIFEKEAYAKVFTVQWQYMNLYTKKIKVDISKKEIQIVK